MEWSRKRIVAEAIDLLYSGGHLSSHYITKNRPDLHNAIYYSRNGKRKYFQSFIEFRTTVSKKLLERGDRELAIRIISPDYKQKIISEEEDARRRTQTLETLEQKIASKENLGLRFQKKNHVDFYDNCVRYFGTYRGAFEAKNLDYEQYVTVKKDKIQYAQQFIQLLQENPSIIKREILTTHKKLWDRLRDNYGSNTRALQEIAQIIPDKDLVERILSFKDSIYKPASRQKRLEREKESRETVRIIESDQVYTRRDFPELIPSNKFSGQKLYARLKNSRKFYSTRKAAKILGCGTSNLLKNQIHKNPDKIIKYKSGAFESYFFDKSLFENYTPKTLRVVGNLESFAREHDISYSKVRSMLHTLGSDSRLVGRTRELSEIEIKILTLMLRQEKVTHKRIVESIDVEEDYSINWLNTHGIPISVIRRQMLEGNIPSKTENGTSLVSGKEVKAVLKSSKNTFRYLLSINIPGYFDTGMHSLVQILRSHEINKYLLTTRAKQLLHEDYSSVYVLSKDTSRRKYTLISDEGKELILNWDNRFGIKLERALRSDTFKHTQLEAIRAKQSLESLMIGSIRRKAASMFENITVLRDYTSERLLIGDVDVSFKHLYLLYKIMLKVGHTHVDIDKKYSLQEITQKLEVPKTAGAFAKGTLFDELSKIIDTSEFAISQEYDYLVEKMMARNKLSDMDSRIAGEKGLRWAIQHFREGHFVAFASTMIQKNLQWAMYNNKTLSLDKGLVSYDDEDYTLKNFVPAKSETSILEILHTLNDN
jgi:hypothetical protein